MKVLIQRVSHAEVMKAQESFSVIGKGVLVFLGVEKGDTIEDLEYLTKKVTRLRIFEDTAGRMNLSVADIKGDLLVVSQFTLAASCKKGNRPSFEMAEDQPMAEELYELFIEKMRETGLKICTGEFGAHMHVSLVNDGPVTILLDSRRR